MTKYLLWIVCCAVVVQLWAQPMATFQVYAGYLGVATVMGRGCTVVATNPFKLGVVDPFAGPAYSPPDIVGVRVRRCWILRKCR